jgi:hypothetical protein
VAGRLSPGQPVPGAGVRGCRLLPGRGAVVPDCFPGRTGVPVAHPRDPGPQPAVPGVIRAVPGGSGGFPGVPGTSGRIAAVHRVRAGRSAARGRPLPGVGSCALRPGAGTRPGRGAGQAHPPPVAGLQPSRGAGSCALRPGAAVRSPPGQVQVAVRPGHHARRAACCGRPPGSLPGTGCAAEGTVLLAVRHRAGMPRAGVPAGCAGPGGGSSARQRPGPAGGTRTGSTGPGSRSCAPGGGPRSRHRSGGTRRGAAGLAYMPGRLPWPATAGSGPGAVSTARCWPGTVGAGCGAAGWSVHRAAPPAGGACIPAGAAGWRAGGSCAVGNGRTAGLASRAGRARCGSGWPSSGRGSRHRAGAGRPGTACAGGGSRGGTWRPGSGPDAPGRRGRGARGAGSRHCARWTGTG